MSGFEVPLALREPLIDPGDASPSGIALARELGMSITEGTSFICAATSRARRLGGSWTLGLLT